MQQLSFVCDDHFLDCLAKSFTSDEELLFAKSFKAYLQYGQLEQAYVIDLDDIWQWMGYAKKGKAKDMLLKHFKENTDFIIEHVDKDNLHGGHNKERILLTVSAFKKYCMKANTSQGDKICNYYLKLENVTMKYIMDINTKQQKEIETAKEEFKENTKTIQHASIMTAFSKKDVVYILYMKPLSGKQFVVKIGHTDDIADRLSKINNEYGTKAHVLKCFECQRNSQFETAMKNDILLVRYRYTEPFPSGKVSTECFVMPDEAYLQKIIRKMQHQVIKYKGKSIEYLREERKLKQIDMINSFLACYTNTHDDFKNKLLDTIQVLWEKDEFKIPISLEDDNIDINIMKKDKNDDSIERDESNKADNITTHECLNLQNNIQYTKKINNTNVVVNKPPHQKNGPYIHVYDSKDTKKLLFVFDNYKEMERQIPGSKHSTVKTHAKNKTEHLGYRWFLVDKNTENPKDPKDIGESQHPLMKFDKIAQLDTSKKIVLKVFKNKKEAYKSIGVCSDTLTRAIDDNTVLKDFYWTYWSDLSTELREKYGHMIDCSANPNHHKIVPVECYNPITGETIERFSSMSEVYNKYHISIKTLKKYIEKDTACDNGFKWRVSTN